MTAGSRMERLRRAYAALRKFDAQMDHKYGRDPSCNRRQQLSLDEIDQRRAIEAERGQAAAGCTEADYARVVAEFNTEVTL